ncbi:MAG TPA: biopolymer transporter ExbD [Stenomitos sp.]
MRFKSRLNGSELPEVNLIPMMDVLMAVLTFFIIISMTMSNQRALNIILPSSQAGSAALKAPDPLNVGVNVKGQLSISGKPVDQAQMVQAMQGYLRQNQQGAVVLNADRDLPYKQVVKLLGTMQDIGGDRVSLAIE